MATCEIDYQLVDADAMAQAFNDHYGANFESILDAKLAEKLSPEQIQALAGIKADIVAKTKADATMVKKAEADAISSTADKIESSLKSTALTAASGEALLTAQAVAEAHEVFNAEAALTFPEPKFSEPKFTSPVDIQDVNYSLKEDYPHSYGHIDEMGNWWKVNKKKGIIDFVHKSGTFIQIDNDGNVTEHVAGSKKEVIQGDLSIEVYGNRDTLIHGNEYTHIDKDTELLVDGNTKVTLNGTEDKTVAKAGTWTYSAALTQKVSADYKIDVGGSVSYKAGGTFTVNGATINLN